MSRKPSSTVCTHWCVVKVSCRVSLLQDWWDFGPQGCLHGWTPDGEPPPWKPKPSLMMNIPGAESNLRIRTDLAHTWAIGFGKEFCAGALLSMCDMGLFNGRSVDAQLSHAYDVFRQWCFSSHESCKITEFSKKTLKISSNLGLNF